MLDTTARYSISLVAHKVHTKSVHGNNYYYYHHHHHSTRCVIAANDKEIFLTSLAEVSPLIALPPHEKVLNSLNVRLFIFVSF
jgi:hypothetical protein